MPKFRKKPVVIEAVQWTGENLTEIAREFVEMSYSRAATGELQIHTEEGVMTASIGDWIICGVQGEFYPCKPDIFAKTYDAVTEGA